MAGGYNPEKHNRRSLRLRGYEYSGQGAYYVTICTQNRECLFGDIKDNEMALNTAGKMVNDTWNGLKRICHGIVIDEYIIMPNHVHGIIRIVGAPLVGALSTKLQQNKKWAGTGNDRAGTRPAPTALGNIVGIFKSITTHQYTINVYKNNWPPFSGRLWQRNYYERIVRNETEMDRIRQYIIADPSEWENDENNPERS